MIIDSSVILDSNDKLSDLINNREMTYLVQLLLLKEDPEILKLIKDNPEWQFLLN